MKHDGKEGSIDLDTSDSDDTMGGEMPSGDGSSTTPAAAAGGEMVQTPILRAANKGTAPNLRPLINDFGLLTASGMRRVFAPCVVGTEY